jgi:hypothetical protein
MNNVERKRVRPTCRMPLWPLVDLQALPPAGWCVGCGAEVYAEHTDLCKCCEGRERDETDTQPLSALYTGTQSPGMR